jgi:hypothetical protein
MSFAPVEGRGVEKEDVLFLQEDEQFESFDLDEDDADADELEGDSDDSMLFD